jgi:hypothetical protein
MFNTYAGGSARSELTQTVGFYNGEELSCVHADEVDQKFVALGRDGVYLESNDTLFVKGTLHVGDVDAGAGYFVPARQVYCCPARLLKQRVFNSKQGLLHGEEAIYFMVC